MKIISHRGNIKGPIFEKENRPSYIDCALGNGYDVEIDIRTVNGELWLGHDEPQYKITHTWLKCRKDYLWIHCKDLETAKQCWEYKSFCHTSDPYTYTSTGKIWLHDLSMKIDDNVIIPLISNKDLHKFSTIYNDSVYAICTDYPVLL
jgi:hypothetical protein